MQLLPLVRQLEVDRERGLSHKRLGLRVRWWPIVGLLAFAVVTVGLPGRIERTDILGGLVHEYHAVAA